MAEMPEPEAAFQERWHDLLPLLDQELSKLPDKYRVPIILCDLEGKTRKEAARQLGCPEGTVAGRLARARTMLAKRLARHGAEISGASLAVMLSENAVSAGMPILVVSSTIEAATLVAAGQAAATGAISAKVAALTEGVLKAMLLTKLKLVTVLLVVTALSCAVGLIYQSQAAERPSESKKGDAVAPQKNAVKSDKEQIQGTWVRVEVESDGENHAETQDVIWTFKKDTFRTCWKRGDAAPVVHNGTYRLNPKANLPEIDFTFLSQTNPNLKGPWNGIYEIKGDTLRICYDDASNVRPKELKSFPPDVNRDCTVFTFKRAKQEQKDEKSEGPKRDKSHKP